MRALDSNTILILTFVIAPLSDASEVRQRRHFRIHQSVAGRSWGIMPTMDKFCDVAPAEVATIASVLSDPARAAILISLVDGCARTAGELAFVAGISAPTASSHLAKLVDSGLITVIPQGPHRYHRLVRLETAQAPVMLFSAGTVTLPPLDRVASALHLTESAASAGSMQAAICPAVSARFSAATQPTGFHRRPAARA
jgi:DNA-binding transcriptional ArsR family regulator